ncbi:MAG: Verru_Chthon cassette protein B [Blastochloris sp.]|nr:Verru_Chthon cassette protein B [Blastochloris sp.]
MTFSLGIMAFVLVTLLGMIPVSLNTYMTSVDLTTQANIAQRLYTMVQQTPFGDSNFSQLNGDYYFDDEGFVAAEDNFVYHAKLRVPSQATEVPTAAGSAENPEMRTLVIEIARGKKWTRLL